MKSPKRLTSLNHISPDPLSGREFTIGRNRRTYSPVNFKKKQETASDCKEENSWRGRDVRETLSKQTNKQRRRGDIYSPNRRLLLTAGAFWREKEEELTHLFKSEWSQTVDFAGKKTARDEGLI